MAPTQADWANEYKALEQRYTIVENHNKQLLQSNHNNKQYVSKLKAEIRSLQRKLRDANRGAERNCVALHLAHVELLEYKLKYPIWTGADLAKDKDQTVTYPYTIADHVAKIQQQQQNGD